jgi:SnoaL-like domain
VGRVSRAASAPARRAPAQRRAVALLLGCALWGCGGPTRRPAPPLADQAASGDGDPQQALLSELQSDVLDAYERDEPPELDTSVIPVVGSARIGVGPGDVLVEQELDNASSRWPLMIGANTTTAVRSKRLEIHLAADQSAAWMSDEVSWRIEICGRTLVIPLRLTALFARDGDRWVLALEHLSTGVDVDKLEGRPGRSIPPAQASPTVAAAVATAVGQALQVPAPASPLLSTGPESVLIGPGWSQEWHGADLTGQRLVSGTLRVAETLVGSALQRERRIGVVGRSVDSATVAFWVGNLLATTADGVSQQLRGSFVLERRHDQWVVVQGHVSVAVDDETLAQSAVGSALIKLNPLTARCDDAAAVPGAASP